MTMHKRLIGLALFALLLGTVSIVVAAAGIQAPGMSLALGPSAQSLDAWKRGPGTATPGETIAYTITIQPYVAADMAMTDTLPAGVAYAGNLSWSTGDAWYDGAENTVYWEYEAPIGVGAPSAPGVYAWMVLAAPPTATTRPAGAVDADGNFYIIGGDSATQGGQIQHGQVQRYDPVAGTWDNSLATMPVPLSGLCAAVVGDDIYVPGGLVTSTVYSELQVYHIDSDDWEIMASDALPEARGGAACAAYGGKVYVIGGYSGAGYVDTTSVYDPAAAAGSRWTTLESLPQASGYGAALPVGDLIFYAGMRDNIMADLPDVYAYDPAADSWTPYPDLVTARGGAGMWAIGDLLLVGGGGWSSYLTSVEQYDTTQGSGGAWSGFEASLVQGRRTFACASDPAHGRLFAGNGWADAILKEAEQLGFEGLPPAVEISFDVTVTGSCGDVIVNQGTAELDGATAEFSATTAVGGEALIAVSPASLGAALCTDSSGTQTLSICNEGGCPLDWEVEEQAPVSRGAASQSDAADIPWLSASPVAGTLAGGACQDVDVTFDATDLVPGGYTAGLMFLSNDPSTPATAVPVSLTVEGCGRFIYLPAVVKGGQ